MQTRSYKAAILSILFICLSVIVLHAQNGTIRGKVFDKNLGTPIGYGSVFIDDGGLGTMTDDEGFFNIVDIPEGTHVLSFSFLGYDSLGLEFTIKSGQVLNRTLYATPSSIEIEGVVVSGKKQLKKKKVLVSTIKLSQKQLKALPSTGGEADIAQYLPVLPGVIFSGDQGGQLYIRGGSPIQNMILLDGVPIYNPFHSIGFFSVFETETIQSVDVLTGGFNAEYGGRISAIVDIKTREGNRKRHGVTAGINPFVGKLLLEGPILKLDTEGKGGSISYMFTAKHSIIDKTSKQLYGHVPGGEIPFKFDDIFGKVSLIAASGSQFDFFGFNFKDRVAFNDLADYEWNTLGGGMNFTLLPKNSPTIITGRVGFSDYQTSTSSSNESAPRSSGINGFNFDLKFTNYGKKNEVNYGIGVSGFKTTFNFENRFGVTINQQENTTEINSYVKYKHQFGGLIIEPGVRLNFYASLNTFSPEWRLGMKYNVADFLRIKLAGGLYSQNLTSTVNDRDIVNLFVGYLSGPEEIIFKPNSTEKADHHLQKALHAIGGVEIDITNNIELNIEPYVKEFTQLINLNRNKQDVEEPNFVTESGRAVGLDFLLKYQSPKWYIWSTYSLGKVNRDDGEQVYNTNFDRRHNVNFLATYSFGRKKSWEASMRWNFGTGFPFTRTQGFYQLIDINKQGIDFDYLKENGELGIVYSSKRNDGRLPTYHRLDLSIKKSIKLFKYGSLDITAGVSNVYNRQNIFYFDRVQYKRVNQLPVLPSVGMVLKI